MPTFIFCTPCTHAAPMRPARKGSSEKYSKFLPQRGLRLMFTPGPSTVDTPRLCASTAIADPTSSIRFSSQLEAVVTAPGKQVAGSGVCMMFTPPDIFSLLRPTGPSLMRTAGMSTSSRLTGRVSQVVEPEHIDTFSSSVSF